MGSIGPAGGRLAVAQNDDTIGTVFWFRHDWGLPDTSWCWEIAVHIFPESRGRGFGTQCQRLLVDYLFDHTRAWRMQAVTDVENIPEQKALARIGFTREGILRGLQWREGQWHDQLIFSLLRSDLLA
jgi:RimJ/RimL family protein N-acetyltransferase